MHTTQVIHKELHFKNEVPPSFIWEQMGVSFFDELIVSWNASRPTSGAFLFSVSLFTGEWSDWINYAFWGTSQQYTFDQTSLDGKIKTYQDVVEVLNGIQATGYRIQIECLDGASLKNVRSLHACCSLKQRLKISDEIGTYPSINLALPRVSQLALDHQLSMRICSPSSVTSLIRYFKPFLKTSPLTFAEGAWDKTFDIYGNWILNTARASELLGPAWNCYVGRLQNFDMLYAYLKKGLPVAVSLKGTLPGSHLPYENGHILVVKGFDQTNNRVLCMDPAFETDEKTEVGYDLKHFLTAWNQRQGLAYLFTPYQRNI